MNRAPRNNPEDIETIIANLERWLAHLERDGGYERILQELRSVIMEMKSSLASGEDDGWEGGLRQITGESD
jgi:hypothetical protein